MRARGAAKLALVVALALGAQPEEAGAHAAVVGSDPAAGAELGAAPTRVTLTFSEQPEASLTEIEVLGESGTPLQRGRAAPVAGDPLTLGVAVPRLARGVYTVDYRTVSAVDGHATAGAFAFGVRASPTGVAVAPATATPDTSAFEVLARWLLLLGLVVLIGAGVAGAGRFGGSRGTDLSLAAAGWLASVVGVVSLAISQRSAAGSTLGELLETPVGEALIWRAVALIFAGVALIVARRRPAMRRGALAAAALAAVAAVAVHVDAGHAAAGGWSAGLTVTTQVAHVVAAGVWFGGLAALLLGVRGAPSQEKAAAVRRFSMIAGAALVLVLVTGTVRSVDELGAWDDLLDTGYGRAVLAKIVLIALIFGLAARNRRRSVPAAATDLEPLRRTSRIELGLAVGALVVAALLGTLAPPVAGQSAAVPGISVSGSDFATTVTVGLTAASDEPGPNRFVAQVDDYDTSEPVDAGRVSIRFRSLDDPDLAASTLELRPTADGSYAGAGANLTVDGRWEATVLVERGGDSVTVPLQIDLPLPEPQLSFVRLPDRPPEYTLTLDDGTIVVSPDPERPGPSRVSISLFSAFDPAPTTQIVVTGAARGSTPEEKPVRRLGPNRFVADVDLEAGPYSITIVATTVLDERLAAPLELDVPAD